MKTLLMKKKWIIFVALLCIAIVVSHVIIDSQKKKEYEEKYSEAFIDLFVTERNEVLRLYEAIGKVIEIPSDRNYEDAYAIACETENTCKTKYAKMTNLKGIIIYAQSYYSTFYRDVKAVLSTKTDATELQDVYGLFGKIISLYDKHSNPMTARDKIEEMNQFFTSLMALNEEMNLINRILQ